MNVFERAWDAAVMCVCGLILNVGLWLYGDDYLCDDDELHDA